jgi:drug/metabolite transporter (DMT)-like permease
MKSNKTGIYYLVIGMCVFTFQDIIIKLLSDKVNLFQILFIRSIMTIVFVLIYLSITKQIKLLSISTPIMTTIRSLVFFIGFIMFYYAQAQMPVANALTLFYVSPFFISIFSMFLLGEKISLVRWVIIFLGFSGVYFIANPNFKEFNYINLLPVLCALFYGLFMVLTKKYSTTESSFVQIFYLSMCSLITTGVLGLIIGDGKYYTNSNVSMNYLSRSWNFMDGGDIGLMLLSAFCGFIGTVFLINAYRIGDPSRITVFEYSGLIPTMLLGFIIWNDIPTNKTWLGVLIIIGCGLYLFNKENYIPDKSPQEIN